MRRLSPAELSLWKTGVSSPAGRSGPRGARRAAPRWVSAAGDRRLGPREGEGEGGEEDPSRDFARHDSRGRVGKRKGRETEKAAESGSSENKGKEGERGNRGKAMRVTKNRGAWGDAAEEAGGDKGGVKGEGWGPGVKRDGGWDEGEERWRDGRRGVEVKRKEMWTKER